MKQEKIEQYARLAVEIGANIQPGQVLCIRASVDSADFARLCAKEAYKLHAKRVIIEYNDDVLNRLTYENASVETLEKIPSFSLEYLNYFADEGCAILNITSEIPGKYEGIDMTKIQNYTKALTATNQYKKYRSYTMGNKGQWSIVSVPNPTWAKKIFPDLEQDAAIEKLWEAILSASHVLNNDDPVSYWRDHNLRLHKLSKVLNDYNFESLYFKNSLGTDIEVGLVPNHVWCGGSEISTTKIEFNPNIPTEEVFTMPNRDNVNGIVYATKPLNFQGVLIDNFWVKFKDGKVIDFDAKDNKEALEQLINMDEGSSHIGEIALISHNSPISNSNILFYTTLYDENASCHMALGAAYPMNIKGGLDMSEEELIKNYSNRSSMHVDFMFGSSDMQIVGKKYDGSLISVFENGNFVI